MSFNWVDALILGMIAISALISLSRGFIKEALSLVTWVVAGVVARVYGGGLAHHFSDYIATPSLQVVAASALLFAAILMVGALINFMLVQMVRATGLTGTDRLLGMVFGAARGTLLVVILVGLLSLAPVQQDSWWQQSTLIPHFLLIADWSKNLILGLSGEWISTAQSARHL
ncbi:CvpA family protein [Denitrificimonas sp. JX-1]|uniref:CvpA family protein n=1 Tax=Denitrificimonas halotolerans TaxID=3098930 RepID=A0ABU5GQI2_9GAMM|nr:CvpA family protein [Denitrificimonas sp. JX-1]MDY7218847.1 CvpA family protein [Denitrificimonas sp. JX-1]